MFGVRSEKGTIFNVYLPIPERKPEEVHEAGEKELKGDTRRDRDASFN